MDRRSFFKVMGVGVGSIVIPSTPKAASLGTQVTRMVLNPKDIIKDPMGLPVLDMNDDVGGIAGHFTLELCCEYVKTASIEDTLALIAWSNRQPMCIGLFFAKSAVTRLFDNDSDPERLKAIESPTFKALYRRYAGVLSMTGGSSPLYQWNVLRT
jgi:hypothetical protein